MFLSQVSPETTTWALATGAFTIVSTQVAKWIFDWQKSRREHEMEQAERQLERDKHATLLRIEAGLESSEKANIERHGEVLLALQGACIVKVNKINKQAE